MIEREDISASVLSAFKARGFTYRKRSSTGAFVLTGPLHTSEGSHECVVLIPQNFDRPPSIALLTVPEVLKPIAPHMDSSGGICYLSRQSIAMDIFDPVGQMLGCLNRAEKVLGQVLRNELVEDLAEEFFAYWGTNKFHCYFDFRVGSSQKLQVIIDRKFIPQAVVVFVTDDVERTTAKSKILGYEASPLTHSVERVYTKVEPRPTQQEWPPKTLGDLIQWQSLQDSRATRKIIEGVSQAAERGEDYLTVMIESPKFFYAFLVFFRLEGDSPTKVELRKKSVLHSSHVIPLRGWRIDERYIIQRNVPGMKTLEHKKIIVIGCGTIGGYLAEMLVKAGAGAGTGELVFVDSDTLSAANLGRHRLGFPYVGRNKADALREELKRNMPDARIRSLPVDVRKANLSRTDLIIDATGEQTVSDYLAFTHARTSQLNVWIEGPGVAVRALIRRNANEACVQCVTRLVRQGRIPSTIEEMPIVYAGQGCESEYVPFPASVSMQAACLASEMVMDWVARKNAPALRTQVVDRAFTKSQEDCTLLQLPDCPACGT
jgi:hypothetical protein